MPKSRVAFTCFAAFSVFIAYGSYSFAADSASVAIAKREEYSARGFRIGVRETWTVTGSLRFDTQSALTTAINALQSAFSVGGGNLILYDNSGNATAHGLISSACRGGTKVISPPNFPTGSGAEYATIRNFSVTVEGLIIDTSTGLLEFEERIDTQGAGGPREVFLPVITGTPRKQTVAQRTITRATQSGSATGYGSYPNIPGPIFPKSEIQEQRKITRISPQMDRGTLHTYRVSWSYSFQDVAPLLALPTIRTGA